MTERKDLPLVGGIIVGATLGAAAAFLFGTPKGKKLRTNLRKRFPEIFGTLDDLAQNSQEYLQELPSSLVEDAKIIMQEAFQAEQKVKEDAQEGRVLPLVTPPAKLKRVRVVKVKQKKYNNTRE